MSADVTKQINDLNVKMEAAQSPDDTIKQVEKELEVMKASIVQEVNKLMGNENELDDEKKELAQFLAQINVQIKTDAMKLQDLNEQDKEAADESKAQLKDLYKAYTE